MNRLFEKIPQRTNNNIPPYEEIAVKIAENLDTRISTLKKDLIGSAFVEDPFNANEGFTTESGTVINKKIKKIETQKKNLNNPEYFNQN